MPRTRSLSDDIVVARATAVFWERGYSATSLRDLTQATGLSSAALYHRFSDKDGLFIEALRKYAEEGLRQRIERVSEFRDPLGAIRDFLDELVSVSLSDPHHRGCLLVNTALDGAPISPEARDLVRERLSDVERFFSECLARAVAEGNLAPETNVVASATALLGTVFAIRVMARLDPEPIRLRALADQALVSLSQTRSTARNESR